MRAKIDIVTACPGCGAATPAGRDAPCEICGHEPRSADGGGARMMQIGEVAAQAGLSLRTVRYYEEVGLVVPSGRTEGGFRLYTDDDLSRLLAVKLVKPLDFTLDEMRDLLETRDRLESSDRLDRSGLDPDERERLTERLAAYVERATDRCAVLRARLESAEAFVRELRLKAAVDKGSPAAR